MSVPEMNEKSLDVVSQMSDPTGRMKWFKFKQVNSGGYFICNEYVGKQVFVQAHSYNEAYGMIKESIERNSRYCDCCGRRWNVEEDSVTSSELPTSYGSDFVDKFVFDTRQFNGTQLPFESDEHYIFYFNDGRVYTWEIDNQLHQVK